MRTLRCAGPVATSCALALGRACPLHEAADLAFYDEQGVTAALATQLLTSKRSLPIVFARDRILPNGEHEPVPTHPIPR